MSDPTSSSPRAPATAFAVLAAGLYALGFVQASWWPLAGGTAAAAAAAWWWTTDPY